jgi:tRNA/tmRNA/rRNA uracil-C5-methylase (TrmA/RlmC/RlmD family)
MNPTMDVDKAKKGNCVLPGYEAGQGECGVQHSIQKLEIAATNLKPHLPHHLSIISCPSEKEEDSWAYRCRCTFQIVKDENERFHYAMRHQRHPVRLESAEFPIATIRIQDAMRGLMENILNTDAEFYTAMKRHLTSATFSSAWQDSREADCIVTLYYEQPIEEEIWKEEAKSGCDKLKLRQLNGRSKKRLICALEDCEQTIRDTLYIRDRFIADGGWDVSLAQSGEDSELEVHYEKPETAFYHPNAYAMKKALKWMLDRLAVIVGEGDDPCSLLEMYCGCV